MKNQSTSTPTRKKMLLLIKITNSILLLGLLFYFTDLAVFLDRIYSLSPVYILLGWIYYSICQWISAYRWQLFLEAKQIHVPIRTLFSFYMVGMFLNNFLPGAVGGDVIKSYDLYHRIQQGSLAVASVFLERFTGLVGLALIAVVAAVFTFHKIDSWLILAAVSLTTLLLAIIIAILWYEPLMRGNQRIISLLFPAAFAQKLHALYEALHSYKGHPSTMRKAIITSVFVQLLFAFYYGLAAMALGIDIDVVYFILFLPVVTIVTMIPLSLGGLGLREGTLVLLFAEVGVSSADVLSISLTVHVINTLLSLWGGVILATRAPVSHNMDTQANTP